MIKKENELLDKFKSIEEKILNELKATDLSIDYTADKKTIISGLKAYIRRVKSIEKILDEYEEISKKLEKVMGDDAKQEVITNAVVGLREDSEELKAEIEVINGNVQVKQKKKKTNSAVKEL